MQRYALADALRSSGCPGWIHEGDADPKLLAYQYLQVLPQIAQGESNKVWIIPSEITQALGNLKSIIPSPDDDGGS